MHPFPEQDVENGAEEDDERLVVDDERLAVDDERLAVDDERLVVDDERLAVDADERLVVDDERLEVDEDEDSTQATCGCTSPIISSETVSDSGSVAENSLVTKISIKNENKHNPEKLCFFLERFSIFFIEFYYFLI